MSKIPLTCKNAQSPVMSFSIFCQESLTKSTKSLENRVTYLTSLKMGKIDKSALAGAVMLGAMAAEATLAEDKAPILLAANTTNSQVRDCMAEAKALDGTKPEKINHLRACKRDQSNERIAAQEETLQRQDEILAEQDRIIAEQERVLTALRERLAAQGVILNKQAQILDENGKVLAQILAVNGRLILQRQQSIARQDAILDEAERYILANS